MKEVICKTNKSGSCLPTELVINKNHMTSETDMTNEFNKFLKTLFQSWPEKSQQHRQHLRVFLNKIDTSTPGDPITINELKEAFFFLKKKQKPRL